MSTPADKLPSAQADELLERALRLPRHDQEYLAARLRAAVREEAQGLHPAWKDEIARRLKKVEDGNAVLIDGDEHLERLRQKFGDF